MTRKELINTIREKKSFLCVGLDTDLMKIPFHLQKRPDALFAFNKEIIDQTKDFCVSYKLNLAFYEAHGLAGWEAMQQTVAYIPDTHFIIADAKRGDIGNTADMYARAFFEKLKADAVTIAPYMGRDSVQPFLNHEGKWAIILGLTSNKGSADFQMQTLADGSRVFERVITECAKWGNTENTMFVVGATQGSNLQEIRKLVPDHFLLVPGFGAQGGSLEEITLLMNKDVGILVNSSRGIIYAGSDESFGDKVRAEAMKVQQQMAALL